jgi:cysteine desulfurase
MAADRIYLDHCATTPLRPEAKAAMDEAFARGGNPGSAHGVGRAARAMVEQARAQVAALVGAKPEHIVFTSGATEATNLAVRGLVRPSALRRVVTTRIEHSATRRAVEQVAQEGAEAVWLGVDAAGRLDLDACERALRDGGPALLSVIAGHNELGVVQRLDELCALGHAHRAIVHLDAVQAAASCDLAAISWDLLTLAGHKIGAPQGIGALVVRDPTDLRPVLAGGAQEAGLRPGTVPVALVAGLGAAAAVVTAGRERERERLNVLRDRLGPAILAQVPTTAALGTWQVEPSRSLPHVVALGVTGLQGDEMVCALDEAGVAASSSSACRGHARSPVLDATGVAADVSLLRLTLGWTTQTAGIDAALPRIVQALTDLRARSPFERRRGLIERKAQDAGLPLQPLHWDVLAALHEYHGRHGILPGPRHLAERTGRAIDLERLFPGGGLHVVATWLALPIPQGGCRPAGT